MYTIARIIHVIVLFKMSRVDGEWEEWGEWTQWSGCGNNDFRTRSRILYSVECPNGFSPSCFGSENQSCSHLTLGDSSWQQWGHWTTCTVTCGIGTQTRTRTCGGNDFIKCSGTNQEMSVCNNGPCPVDGHWSKWGQFSSCNASCGGGVRYRYRTCSNPKPLYGGRECNGTADDVFECNNKSCCVDGHWSKWGQFSSCNASCGGGVRYRYRTCSNPKPLYGGRECNGTADDVFECNNKSCCVLSIENKTALPVVIIVAVSVSSVVLTVTVITLIYYIRNWTGTCCNSAKPRVSEEQQEISAMTHISDPTVGYYNVGQELSQRTDVSYVSVRNELNTNPGTQETRNEYLTVLATDYENTSAPFETTNWHVAGNDVATGSYEKLQKSPYQNTGNHNENPYTPLQ